jgi:hypothetical protein
MGQRAKKRQPMHSAAVVLSRRVFFTQNRANILFDFEPGDHQFMTAAQASQAQIRTCAQNLPAGTAAGMGFLHHKNIL